MKRFNIKEWQDKYLTESTIKYRQDGESKEMDSDSAKTMKKDHPAKIEWDKQNKKDGDSETGGEKTKGAAMFVDKQPEPRKKTITKAVRVGKLGKGDEIKLSRDVSKMFDNATLTKSDGGEIAHSGQDHQSKTNKIKGMEDGSTFTVTGLVQKPYTNDDGNRSLAWYDHSVDMVVRKSGRTTYLDVSDVRSERNRRK